ncbi:MAG: glycosyltransferase family 1 protein [Candidatus Tantalella remota]|nr:glycosyltransferase family 1 protein [Candidatus Tantalella remota]
MRIGIDARMIDHPGIGRYISCLVPELIKQSPKDEFVLFGNRDKLSLLNVVDQGNIVSWDAPIYSIQEQLFPRDCMSNVDIVHVPHFNVPLLCGKKMVVTIHDLIYLLFPKSVSFPLARHYAEFMIRSALKKSEKVITVSQCTKDDLLKIFGDQYASKIDVVHEASGNSFRKVEDKTRIADVKCRYRLGDNIILYVGSVKPHKNTETLIKVFEQLKRWGATHQLVICGRWDKKEDRLKKMMSDPDIKYIGEVPQEDLVVLYSMAEVLVHLSLYEGFGLTVLEAMSCGLPVVVSNTSSLPEVAGKSAFVVDPHDVEQVADTVYNILVSKHLAEGMIETGYEHVKQFSWEKTARETLEVYHSI